MEPSIKGSMIKYNREYLIKTFGQDAVNKMIQTMQQQDKDILSRPILVGSWYPEKTGVNLLDAAQKTFDKGGYEVCRQMGLYCAKQSVPTIYKLFIRFGNPHFAIQKSAVFWRQTHTHGRIEIKLTGPKSTLTHLIDFPCPHKAFCVSLIGFFEATLEMCGCKKISVKETKCRAEGADVCEFPGSWE